MTDVITATARAAGPRPGAGGDSGEHARQPGGGGGGLGRRHAGARPELDGGLREGGAAAREQPGERAALLIGVPLGVVAGREAWAFFAGAAGVATGPDVPLPLVLLTVPVTLLLANAMAALPGWTAARLRPAVVLRAE